MYKPIPSTGGIYEASICGKIRRIVSIVPNHKDGKGAKRVGGVDLKYGKHTGGYLQVAVHINRKQLTRYVHRLVAEAWIGDIPVGMEVNHKDGNKENNHVSNLEIVTKSENLKHAIRTGLRAPLVRKGSKNGRALTTEDEVRAIRKEHAKHRSRIKTQEKFPHLSLSTIANIVSYRNWKHVK